MGTMKIRELIDMAIGFPAPGHVNFSALHCLLICIVEKLEITDEIVDYHYNDTETDCCKKLSNNELFKKARLTAGLNPDENNTNETPTEPEASLVVESPSGNAIVKKELEVTSIEQMEGVHTEEIIENTSFKPPPEEKEMRVFEQNSGSVVLIPKESTSQLSVHRLKERVSKIEMRMQSISMPKAIASGISVMKDQLEFLMEQMLLLTFLTLSKKPDSKQIQQLYSMAQTMLEIKNENTFIEGFREIQIPAAPILNWQSSGLQLNEALSENDTLEAQSIESARSTAEINMTDQGELEGHLCYSPAKILDQLMQMKSEVCLLTNKVNELTARLLEQESQRTLSLIKEVQEQLRDIKLTTVNLKDNQSRMELRLNSNHSSIEHINASIEEIIKEKVDKTHFEIQLASKVDYNQLQRKVSLDQILELQCRIDKKFCDMLRRINDNDKHFSETIENLRKTLGFAAIDEVLKAFKENIVKDIQALQESLKSYIEATNDDCASAGARIKVLHELACLSCDTNCVMRTMEKAKVAKLPSAHASNIISPLITYELGSIRKSGIMGYYRKDEFPHSTNAWLTHQSNASAGLKQCVPRHAGGEHTTNTAKQRIQKTVTNGK